MQDYHFLSGKLSYNRRKQINQSDQVCEQFQEGKPLYSMDTTHSDLENLIKRNSRMQHFKCFTISNFRKKISGTHKTKIFGCTSSLKPQGSSYHHFTWFSLSGLWYAVGLHTRMEYKHSQFRISCMSLCKLQPFLNNLNIVGQDSEVLGSVQTRTALKGSETEKQKNLSLQPRRQETTLKDRDSQ